MEHQSEEILTSNKSVQTPESGIARLIETVELLRRNKIETNRSYSEAFFSTVKNYLG